MVTKIFGYGYIINQFTIYTWNTHFRIKKYVCSREFHRSLVEKYCRHTVYTGGGTGFPPQACQFLHLKHRLYSHLEKNLRERIM
ncbi:MAG TPA: hypothetical protein VFV86_12160 [Nitrososphaeraceae archaeon]|nr:hypothetical protein [Nitrososphaeraceae archaeon]